MSPFQRRWVRWIPLLTTGCLQLGAASFSDPNADRDALPMVPEGFRVTMFAREPMVRQPCSMAFDARGRLHIGMGPQYRNPKPDTPGDSVVMVLDTNSDGVADATKVFATGFNAIQALAWRGRDLWVANSPDLTIVRDIDGDDEADEYVRVYTDLGNLEHGLHGLNFAPDGRLYMSKGNSKGLTQPGRVAPKPFRELWGVSAPEGTPDFPAPVTFTKSTYRRTYHDPEDDWGREGGILRCEEAGRNLEIVARGFRNPWDITADDGFNWLGTDNDQTGGDKVFTPVFGGHYGWNHPWMSEWADAPGAPTAPISGPLFEGSGSGVVFSSSPRFPPSHRGVFFVNDWLQKTTFLWRPRWDGASLAPASWEPFIRGGSSLYRPTDLEIGPDGALWILGWSSGYGAEWKNGELTNEGRVYRVEPTPGTTPPQTDPTPRNQLPLREWTIAELVAEFDRPLPVGRINAQDELVRRGLGAFTPLLPSLRNGTRSTAAETWLTWGLGRLRSPEAATELTRLLETDPLPPLNVRIQALRALADQARTLPAQTDYPPAIINHLRSTEPRLRLAAVEGIAQSRRRNLAHTLGPLLDTETDRTVFYAGWQALRRLSDQTLRRQWLADPRPGVRRAALLSLLEENALTPAEVRPLTQDSHPPTRELATLWLNKTALGESKPLVRGRPLQPLPTQTNTTSAAAAPLPRLPSLVRGLRTPSRGTYLALPSGLVAGARPYSDRDYTLKEVPALLEGCEFIQTANDDDGSTGPDWLTFESLFPLTVYVAIDERLSTPPAWIRENFRPVPLSIRADHWTFRLHARPVGAGIIRLGGNTDDGRAGGKGNYIVLLQAGPPTPPLATTTLQRVLDVAAQGDPARGAYRFHQQTGAACFQCHQLQGHGQPFGPDLAGVGSRATAHHIIESILTPDAVITEGFKFSSVETRDGSFSGILLDESGLAITLGLANGERAVIPRTTITSQRTGPGSAMPSFADVLTPIDVADITAFLLSQKAAGQTHPAPPGPTSTPTRPTEGRPAAPATPAGRDLGAGFTVENRTGLLAIHHRGRPVAELLYADAKILRPGLANLHAPDGTRVTRNHPPIAGTDATDHDTMHPGLWLGFGDINGFDFWRNRGRIDHVQFVQDPVVIKESLHFATECRLIPAPGQPPIGSITNRWTITRRDTAWLIVWQADFFSDTGDLVFGDQEEMGLGARVATPLTEKNGGRILSNTGVTSAARTWGNSYAWCDYSGRSADQTAGILLLPDAHNFRPCWWHNRDYGVFVANPFGREAMKQGPKSQHRIPRGETFTLRFAAAIHAAPSTSPTDPTLLQRQLQELLGK